VNRCPTCRNLVPAGWIACRRCGAALPVARAVTMTAVLERSPASADTLLPAAGGDKEHLSARPHHDNLLPEPEPQQVAAPRAARVRKQLPVAHLVSGAIVIIVFAIVWFTLSAGSSHTTTPPANLGQPVAQQLLRTTAAAARTLYTQHGTYVELSPSELARHTSARVVDEKTIAHAGEVSINARGANALVLATPGTNNTCVFARDEPAVDKVEFVVTNDACRAADAPNVGWLPS